MEIIKSKKEYDVIVVGSGAGGGMATKILSDAGIKVALVESGPYFDPANPGVSIDKLLEGMNFKIFND